MDVTKTLANKSFSMRTIHYDAIQATGPQIMAALGGGGEHSLHSQV